MKAHDLREMTVEDLQNRENALAEQLFAFRMQRVAGQLDKPSKVREARKDLARVLTVLSEKAREAKAKS